MRSTKELIVGKLYWIANPETRYYRETDGGGFGYFSTIPSSADKSSATNSQKFFLFLGRKGNRFRFFTSGHEVYLNPGAVLSLKEATTQTSV
jgi:hypothetical protein